MADAGPIPSESINVGPPPAAPPGWYADPHGSGRRRWWDGAAWTVRLLPSDVSPPPTFLNAAPLHAGRGNFPSEVTAQQRDGRINSDQGRPSAAYAPNTPTASKLSGSGWYPDPGGSGKLRLWDGQKWTRSLIGQDRDDHGRESHLPSVGRSSNSAALAGFTLFVVNAFLASVPGLGIVLGICGIGLSIAGWATHKEKHSRSSRVLAIIGLFGGLVYLFIAALATYTPYFEH